MIKNIPLYLMISVLVQSCAGLNKMITRTPSQEPITECSKAFTNIVLDAGKMLSLDQSKLVSERLKNCTVEEGLEIDSHDRLMYFKSAGNGVLIKTLHGKLLFLEDKSLSVVDVKFPVASFIIENNHVTLYNANDKGRFCTSQVIENHLTGSEPSCKNAADKIEIKDL